MSSTPVPRRPPTTAGPASRGPACARASSRVSTSTSATTCTPTTPPRRRYFSYEHGVEIDPSENCDEENGSSLSGMSFYRGNSGASAFPTAYDGSLFFSDFVRGCIWVMPVGDDGLPDPAQVKIFDVAPGPVDLEQGPDGALYYPSIIDGQIHRISYSTGAIDAPPKPQIDTPLPGSDFSAGEELQLLRLGQRQRGWSPAGIGAELGAGPHELRRGALHRVPARRR